MGVFPTSRRIPWYAVFWTGCGEIRARAMSNWIAIDLDRVRANLLTWLGERLTDAEVCAWLRQLGLRPHSQGRGWVADDEAMAAVRNSGMIEFASIQNLIRTP